MRSVVSCYSGIHCIPTSPAMALRELMLVAAAALGMLSQPAKTMMIKRIVVPHDVNPGHVITSLAYWGQRFRLDFGVSGEFAKYFSVSPQGDIMTNSDVTSLVGEKFSLIVINELASEIWHDAIHLQIQDTRHVIVFPKHSYVGHVLENQPAGTVILNLQDIFAKVGKGKRKMYYSFTSGPVNLFEISEHVDGKNHIQIVTKIPLDREHKQRHVLSLKAVTANENDAPAFAKIIVFVGDENDNIPKFEKSYYVATLTDSTPPLTTVVRVKAVDPDDGKIKYVMEPHKYFRIDPDHGHIILKSKHGLRPDQYQLKVYAEDSGGQVSDKVTVDVKVSGTLRFEPNVHLRHKRSAHPMKEFEVPESRVGELIRITTGSNEHRFHFVDPAPSNLDINPRSGAVSLRQGERLDFEKQEDIVFTVVITSNRDTSVRIEQPVKIKLTDVNDEIPRFVNVPRPFLATVSQNAPPGTSVYQLMARDDDRDSIVQYSLESGGEDRFEVDAESGVVRTRDNQPFRPGKEYEIGVSAQDKGAVSSQKSPTHSLRILVGERNPQFYETQYVAYVREDAHVQDPITEVKAYSHQGYPITYELMTVSGGSSNEFAISQNKGVVDLLRTLDYEKDPEEYHLRVRATENGRPPRYSTVNLIVNLVDINDNKPMFPLSQYIVQGIAETVANGTHIIQVTATDLDSVTNSQLTYSVSDANFTVESLNNIGYIKTARTLDYDMIPDHTYNFTVIATDNGTPAQNGSAMVRVTVTNVNDEDPKFSQAVEHVQVSEDAPMNTMVHVVQAYDPDGDEVTYSFAGERLTEGPFRIAASSGILTLVGQMDKTQVSYRLNIKATDNGRCCGGKTSRSSYGQVIVQVKDVNNNAPRFPDCNSYNPTVLEREDVGTSVIRVLARDSDTGDNGNVTYSLVKSLDQDSSDRFTIDAVQGIVRTADIFDREARTGITDYGVTVKAEDQGAPSLAGFCTFRVHIGDKNDNPPVFDFPSYGTSLEEGSPIGKRVLQVYATDKDAGPNGEVAYFLKHDPSGFFEVHQHSGWITVRRAMSGLDNVDLEVEGRDGGSPSRSSEVTVSIEITQTVNAYPQWLQDYSMEPIKLSENVPVNYIVKRLKALSSVPDATVNYLIKNGETPEQNAPPQSFYQTINASTNEMLLRVYRALDYETVRRYTLTIKAANRATNSLHNATRLTIELIDKNDEIPQFVGLDENGRYPGSVSENMDSGAEVITVTATDRDMYSDYNKITYSIKPHGSDYDKFAINPETGVITTRDTFDREQKDEYYITVIAQDGAKSDRPFHYPPGSPNQGEAEVQVRITDKNDNAPYFREERYQASVPENTDVGAVVITVTAEDEDEENRLSYSITGGNVGNSFEVVPDLGQIKVRGNLDYENGPRDYHLIYRVFDDKFANTATVLIRITDVNDNPPRFEPAEYSVGDVMEEDPTVRPDNPKFLVRVHAEDPDIDRRSNIRYSLTGQFADQGYFTINEMTGDIYVTKALDRDKPYGRPVWNFNVLAHDEPGSGQSLTGYAIVQVKPSDINDNPPVFDNNRLEGKVLEHSRAGVSVLTVIATDADSGNNGTVTYSLKQVPVRDGNALFAINPNTGLITTTTNNALDREIQPIYRILVQARDQGTPEARSASSSVIISVEDINDHSPRFTQKTYETSMSENCQVGASVTSVSASDPDVGPNAKMTYTLMEKDREYFYMTSVEATNTGVLKVFKPVDFDTLASPFFNLTVYVSDPDTTHLDTARIGVKITDFNDNPPVFVPNSKKANIDESVEVGQSLARFSATDRDTDINRQFVYAIDRDTDPMRQFTIDTNGLVRVARPLDRETTPVHRVHILAIDKGSPPQTGTGTLIVTLNDVNDNFPEFAENYKPVIYENEKEGMTVVTISAIDKDTASNGPPFEFWLPCHGACPCSQNPTCADFGFKFIPEEPFRGGGLNGQGSGIVTTKRTFDRERQKYYYLPIIMKDSGNPPTSGTNTLTIIIGDRNDNKHNPGHKNVFVYNYKGEFANAPLGKVYAEDKDDWDIKDKAFYFDSSSSASRYFQLDKNTGDLSMKGQVREGDYTFQVHVNDRAWKRDVVSSVTVKVREIGDDAVYSSGSVRFSGITAEEFINRPKIGVAVTEYDVSKYDIFRTTIAKQLGVPTSNVDIFTVMNHPTLPRTCDVRFAAHGSPYYQSARLDGIINQNKEMFEDVIGVRILMVPIDECLDEQCESGGCSNRLVTTTEPLLVNTNGTSIIGITAFVEANCECAARQYSTNDLICRPDTCLNGGTCRRRGHGYECDCRPGFNGHRCQQTHHSFNGDSWAWFKPLAQCEDSHTSIEFITTRENGLILYNGPMRSLEPGEQSDFILLEMKQGYPQLRINHGSGEGMLTINGKDGRGDRSLSKLNDGRWHRVDVYRKGKEVRMVVDYCKSAYMYENENDGDSIEDRLPCEAKTRTPGDNRFINVNTPLQLGGRSSPFVSYPLDVMVQGFDGCVKNLIHNGELYDLHTGKTGEHHNSEDGCPSEEYTCGKVDVDGPRCGLNGTCVATLEGEFTCICDPGWRGPFCDQVAMVRDFRDRSYMEWDFKETFYRTLEHQPRKTKLQLMFRTRQNSGLLFKVQNIQKSEYMILELKEERIRFRYNLGSGENMVALSEVDVSDGEWHTAFVERVGRLAILKLDGGEGRYYNYTEGSYEGHLWILVARRQFYAGGDIKFPTSDDPAIVDYDFRDSCMSDIRYDDHWLPMDNSEDYRSYAAELKRYDNLGMGCNSSACSTLRCAQPQVCWDLWRMAECRCPVGQRWNLADADCININECLEQQPCVHGSCTDLAYRYYCDCQRGWRGDHCDQRHEAAMVIMSKGAVLIIIVCALAFLVLVFLFIMYSRRRRPEMLVVTMDPDDDIRENIIHYDEEGVGEEDQDAYDINRLKKPVDEPITKIPQTVIPDPPKRAEKPRKQYAPGETPDVGNFIDERLHETNDDPAGGPLDELHEYHYEGNGSVAGSLSSLASTTDSGEQNYDYLGDWGPRFKKLANIYDDPMGMPVDEL